MMEVRLIDANALKNSFDSAYTTFGQCVYAKGIVDRQPTIEAEIVRHGRWIKQENGMNVCSSCGVIRVSHFPFCGNCGARMDADHIADVSKKVGGTENYNSICMIPCSERMPDKDGKYLVLLNNNAWDTLEYDTELEQFGWTDDYKDELGYNITEWYDSTKMVVSWMPLPEKL